MHVYQATPFRPAIADRFDGPGNSKLSSLIDASQAYTHADSLNRRDIFRIAHPQCSASQRLYILKPKDLLLSSKWHQIPLQTQQQDQQLLMSVSLQYYCYYDQQQVLLLLALAAMSRPLQRLLLVHWSTSYELLSLVLLVVVLPLFPKLPLRKMYPAAPHAAGGCYSSLYRESHQKQPQQ
jgi:hypothetical protein